MTTLIPVKNDRGNTLMIVKNHNGLQFVSDGMQIAKPGIKNKMLVITNEMLLEENPVLEPEEVADILQNDISQTLAATLLLLQSARENKTIGGEPRLQLAETHLKTSIQKLVRLHYSLLQ